MDKLFFISVVIIVNFASGARLPSNFNRCARSDPNFKECLRTNVQDAIVKLANGNKQLAILPLDPLVINEIRVEGTPGQVQLEQTLKNVRIYGLSKLTVDKFEMEVKNGCYIKAEASMPTSRSELEFILKGQLLVFPINGHGPGNVTLSKLKTIHDAKCEHYNKNGEDHIRIVDYKLQMLPEKVHYDLKNIVANNEQLSREILKTVNENSKLVFEEIRPATEFSYAEVFKAIANNIFDKVPVKEIFID